ncbi:MAG TPA: biopolymer transporter ExbD [Acidobacteriota bacterium]|nr:biopolymer transporter ExbD [Acidobacteriota bacterium]
MKVKKQKVQEAYIPTASMSDIAFLLIIFFMVSSIFPVDKTQMDLPGWGDVKNYLEDSAVIAISTENLIYVRNNVDRSVRDIANMTSDRVIIMASDGRTLSQEVYQHNARTWDMSDPAQFQNLRDSINEGFIKKVALRRMQEGNRAITIVVKADKKVPFYAVDGVVEALQVLGGQASTGIAILSKKEGPAPIVSAQ